MAENKKETEFNLSEKISKVKYSSKNFNWINTEDVKSFLRILKEKIIKIEKNPYINSAWDKFDKIIPIIDKLAGDKLI